MSDRASLHALGARVSLVGASIMAAALCGACIDTELGLVVELESASIRVHDEGAGPVVRVNVDVFVRVGNHALAGDSFVLPEVSVFRDEAPVAQINLERPEDFVGRLEPGESTTVRLTGSAPVSAFPAAAELCDASAVEVVIQWTADTQAEDPLDPPNRQMGSSTTNTFDVDCS